MTDWRYVVSVFSVTIRYVTLTYLILRPLTLGKPVTSGSRYVIFDLSTEREQPLEVNGDIALTVYGRKHAVEVGGEEEWRSGGEQERRRGGGSHRASVSCMTDC